METYIHSPGGDVRRPFVFADQDVVNAILGSASFRVRREILPYADAPHAPFRGVRVDGALGCVDGAGNRPFLLHHALQKPWLEALPSNPYTEFLPRYLHHRGAPPPGHRPLPPSSGREPPGTWYGQPAQLAGPSVARPREAGTAALPRSSRREAAGRSSARG